MSHNKDQVTPGENPGPPIKNPLPPDYSVSQLLDELTSLRAALQHTVETIDETVKNIQAKQ